MSVFEFEERMKELLASFRVHWEIENLKNPENFPDKMDWVEFVEQFDFYHQERT